MHIQVDILLEYIRYIDARIYHIEYSNVTLSKNCFYHGMPIIWLYYRYRQSYCHEIQVRKLQTFAMHVIWLNVG